MRARTSLPRCSQTKVTRWPFRPTRTGRRQELVFRKRDYERKFFSDETNLSFVRCFLDNAKLDPLTGEIGKSIMFAVSRKHATKLVTLLNEEAMRRWPARNTLRLDACCASHLGHSRRTTDDD